MRIGFIGTGNMGGALASACAAAISPQEIYLANRTPAKAAQLAQRLGAQAAENAPIAAECDYIFLGVKPQNMAALLTSLQVTLAARRTPFALVSMAAGVSIAALQKMAGGAYPVIRIMPNTACAVGAGMTLYTCSPEVTAAQKADFLRLMEKSGLLEEMAESLMDAGSAVAGCGGAFACLFLEGLADGGVLCGLPRQTAQRLAAQMLLGSAKLALAGGQHTAEMKDAICSPGGTTIAGVRKLEQRAFRSAAMEAVIAAFTRTEELKQ